MCTEFKKEVLRHAAVIQNRNTEGKNNFFLIIKLMANDNSISDACSNIYRLLQFMSFEPVNKIF